MRAPDGWEVRGVFVVAKPQRGDALIGESTGEADRTGAAGAGITAGHVPQDDLIELLPTR